MDIAPDPNQVHGMPVRPPRAEEPSPKPPSLLSSVCHDLRAPLAAVQMGTSFVLQSTPESPDNERARKILAAVLRSCGQMDRLLRNFSDLSHIEARDVSVEKVEHDARSVVELALAQQRDAAAARRIELRADVDDAPVPARLDRDRIVRALAQLIDNAVRYGPEGEPVDIRVEPRGDDVVFTVTDRGPGLPDDVRAHLFDRVWHSTRAGRPGTGLGLAIARGFAELHGGSVEAEAPAGGPTRFLLRIPRS